MKTYDKDKPGDIVILDPGFDELAFKLAVVYHGMQIPQKRRRDVPPPAHPAYDIERTDEMGDPLSRPDENATKPKVKNSGAKFVSWILGFSVKKKPSIESGFKPIPLTVLKSKVSSW